MKTSTDGPHNMKCPCCKNPWAAATGDFFARICQECEDTSPKGLSRGNMDFSVHPKDDFYLYANGEWLKKNPIPSGYPNWNSFLTLHTQSQENLKNMLEELSKSGGKGGGKGGDNISEEERKVSLFYKAAMDEDAIEVAGVSPLKPLLDACDKAVGSAASKDSKGFASILGTMCYQYGISPFFSIGVSPDKMNSDHSIAQLSQGGLGLPDRDYYFDEDKEDKREAYKKCVANFLTLLEDPSMATTKEATPENVALATKILDLEKTLAESHMTRTENRDPHETFNKMSMDKLMTELCSNEFDFGSYFLAATGKSSVEDVGEINVRNTKAIAKAAEVAASTDSETLKGYLKWKVVASCAPYLSSKFVQEHFKFYETVMMGTKEIKERWKRAMGWTDSALGEALGKLYCAKYFDESSKQQALDIVEQVRQALEDRLKEVDWIKSDSTREQALKKMENFRVKIGYPDEWIDYGPLAIDPVEDSFLDMVLKAREFENSIENKEMNAPTNRKKWFMAPHQVNAYYHPNLNEIVFPAAILQHPFFDKDADPAVNFGAMGAVVGHEMTHGFDDKGRKFNYLGVLSDWWTESDSKEYEERVDVMVEQANNFEVHGQKVQGKLTSGENIADLGGLRLAYRALKATPGFDDTEMIDGFSPTQRFFLSWAQCWRQNITKERSLQLLTIDPHGPNSMRCNGVVSNIPEFHNAFDVKENDPMHRPEDVRVNIW
ncbi:MAG: hypothetical protein SGBAC_004079 [Bacillariaceae sp.]